MAIIAGIGKTFDEFNLELATMDKDSIMLKLITSNMVSKEDYDTLHLTSHEELRNLIYLLRQIEDIYTKIYPVK